MVSMVKKIIKFPAESLSRVCEDVDLDRLASECLLEHIDDIKSTLDVTPNGLAIASNQIAPTGHRLFVTRPCEQFPDGIVINPRWHNTSDEIIHEKEGCLSFPGVFFPVTRYYRVQVRYYTIDGKYELVDCEGLLARVVQHECEHLDGKNFLVNQPAPLRAKVRADMIRRKKSGR